jgi:hypothetical protein
MDKDEALKLLEEDKNDRVRACVQEVQEILNKYNCTIEPKVVITPNGVDTEILFIAK